MFLFKQIMQRKFSPKKKIFSKKKNNIYLYQINLKYIQKLKSKKIEKTSVKRNFFLSIGRLTKQKNFKFLINCFEKY